MPLRDLRDLLEPSPDQLQHLLDATAGMVGPNQVALHVERGLELLESDGDRRLEALYHLSEAHSTVLREQMMWASAKQLHRIALKEYSNKESNLEATLISQQRLLERRRVLQDWVDGNPGEQMTHLIRQLPPDWTVVQLTAVPRLRSLRKRHATPHMVLARFSGGAPDSLVVVPVPAPGYDQVCPTFREEMESILTTSDSIQRSLADDRKRYWQQRALLDDRMKRLVRSIEVGWLGRLSYLLSGGVICAQQQAAIADALAQLPDSVLACRRAQLHVLCSRPASCDAEFASDVKSALDGAASIPRSDVKAAVRVLTKRRRALRVAALSSPRRGQVILILDKEVQQFPWEMVGPLAQCAACRLPSLALLSLALATRNAADATAATQTAEQKDVVAGKDQTNKGGKLAEDEQRPNAAALNYILNPEGDLAGTEDRMQPFFESRGWRGIVGRPPSVEEFAEALTNGEIMAYCGHGNGSQYLPTDKLRALPCSAVALLFGCGSGRLQQAGPTVEPHGCVHSYLMANCPAVLGNLWSVTDKMLDQYSMALIDHWSGSARAGQVRTDADGPAQSEAAGEGGGTSLLQAASAARSAVSSTFMAAAPVVYGLPVSKENGKQL